MHDPLCLANEKGAGSFIKRKKGEEVSCLFLSVKCFNLCHQGFAVMKAIGLFLLTAFVRRIPNVYQDGLDGSQKHLINCNRNCVTKILLPETHD